MLFVCERGGLGVRCCLKSFRGKCVVFERLCEAVWLVCVGWLFLFFILSFSVYFRIQEIRTYVPLCL